MRHRRPRQNEGSTAPIPGRDVDALLAVHVTERSAVNVLRDLAVTGAARNDATAKLAPTPEAEPKTGTGSDSSACDAELPVRRTVGRGWPNSDDSKHGCHQKPEKGSPKDRPKRSQFQNSLNVELPETTRRQQKLSNFKASLGNFKCLWDFQSSRHALPGPCDRERLLISSAFDAMYDWPEPHDGPGGYRVKKG